jgi:hypothetical protein
MCGFIRRSETGGEGYYPRLDGVMTVGQTPIPVNITLNLAAQGQFRGEIFTLKNWAKHLEAALCLFLYIRA